VGASRGRGWSCCCLCCCFCWLSSLLVLSGLLRWWLVGAALRCGGLVGGWSAVVVGIGHRHGRAQAYRTQGSVAGKAARPALPLACSGSSYEWPDYTDGIVEQKECGP